MSTSEVTADRRSGLANVVDIIIAPNSAFARLREVPTWGWAFLVSSLLAIAGTLMATPATLHALQTGMPAQLAADPNIAKLPPDQQKQQIEMFLNITRIGAQLAWLIVPVLILVIGCAQALFMLIANAVGGGDGSFKKYFALSILVTVIGTGIGSLVLGLIVMLRGVNSFETTTSVQAALPSLALLAPGAKGALGGALGVLNVFYLWGAALLALGMIRVGRIKPPAAWTTAIVILLITGLFGALGGLRSGG